MPDAAQNLPAVGDLHQVLEVQTDRFRRVAAGIPVHRRESGSRQARTVVGCAGKGGGSASQSLTPVRVVEKRVVLIAIRLFCRRIEAGQNLMLRAAQRELLAVIALDIRAGVFVLAWRQARPRQDGVGPEIRHGRCSTMRRACAHDGRPLVALECPAAKLRAQLTAVIETVRPCACSIGCLAQHLVSRRAVEVAWLHGCQRADVAHAAQACRGVDRLDRGACADEPHGRHRHVVHVHVKQPDGEFVTGPQAPAVGRCHAVLVDLGAAVVCLVPHRVQAEGRVFPETLVQVRRAAVVAAGADRANQVGLVGQQRLLADLVDHATCRPPAEDHRGRTAQHFDPVQVEGVAVVLRRVAHAVDQQIADRCDRKPAQADVLVGAVLGGGKGDAGRVMQGSFQRVELDVVDQFFGDDVDRLGNITDVLRALADAGLAGLDVVLALDLGLFRDGHGAERRSGRDPGALGPAAYRGGQHEGAEGKHG